MQKLSNLDPVKRGFNELVEIRPRMLSDQEMTDFSSREAELSDTDEKRAEKLYRIRVDFLAEAAVSAKLIIKDDAGKAKTVDLVENATSPDADIRAYFAEHTPENEKVVTWLYIDIQNQYVPKRDF